MFEALVYAYLDFIYISSTVRYLNISYIQMTQPLQSIQALMVHVG